MQSLSHFSSFGLILAFSIWTLLKNGFDQMLWSGMLVLILIFVNFMICLWQWRLNNLYKYEWMEYDTGKIGDEMNATEKSEKDDYEIVDNNTD